MRLRWKDDPYPERYEWDRWDPYVEPMDDLRSPLFWIAATFCFFGFLAFCALLIVVAS